jgi:uncharacterized membrane protein
MTQTPDIPMLIENDERDYNNTGIVSTVAIFGHPLHPVLVTFPIALLVSALGTDLGYWLTDDPFWARASLWLIGAGFIAGILAAISGMSDFLRIERVRQRSASWAHMFGNIAALLLTLVNWIIRGFSYTGAVLPFGILLSVLVASLLGITGWYGGELVYRHKVSPIGNGSRREY